MTGLSELALYVVLGVEAVAAEGLDRGVCRQQLGQVRLGAARLPRSKRGAALPTISEAASTLAYARATGNWTSWFLPMGLPKTSRSFARAVALSVKLRPSPTHSAEVRMRLVFIPSRM